MSQKLTNEELNTLVETYKMSEEEHRRVFEKLKMKLFSGKKSSLDKSVMFVVGQPGCGKTTFINNTDFSMYTIINSDDYRCFNENSDTILDLYPTNYVRFTNYDAHLIGDELFNYAVSNGYPVLREKAPRNDGKLLNLINELISKHNCQVTVDVVVSGNLESLLATRERYESELLEKKPAKLSNIDVHNEIYESLPDFVMSCLLLGVEVNLVTRDNYLVRTISIDNYDDVLRELRNESNRRALASYHERINGIKRQMNDRKAPQEQFDELDKIESLYLSLSGGSMHRPR